MIRVAQLIDSLQIGGAQKLQVMFARAAKQRDLSYTVVSLRKDSGNSIENELLQEMVPIVSFPAKSLVNWKRIFSLYKFLRTRKFDLIQTHLCTANILGPILGRACNIPVVSTLHSASFDPRFYKRGRFRIESSALRYGATRVVAVGHVVAEANKKRIGRRNIDVIPNAIVPAQAITDPERLQKRTEIFRGFANSAQYVNPSDATLLISVGRLSLPKAYPDLLRAFALVRRVQPFTYLAIVGDGVMRGELKELIHRLKLSDSVAMLGQRSDVMQLLWSADIYVSSSHWEGLPVSILEAMSCSLPIVATSVGDIPRVVTGECGILVPPRAEKALANAILTLVDNQERLRNMGQRARQKVLTDHAPLVWIDQYIALYKEILADDRSSSTNRKTAQANESRNNTGSRIQRTSSEIREMRQ